MRYFTIEIPDGDDLSFAVIDDVDDEGRGYHRSVEGPASIPVQRVEESDMDPEALAYGGYVWLDFYEGTDDGIAVRDEDVPEAWVRPDETAQRREESKP
ncbi:MAG TPA: hypothetical protein VMX12_03155 [Acidimicrobiia bacterium]|nr:hypothetical protein [Acidimicrobiia bacterium]